MNAERIRALQDEGVQFGSHSLTPSAARPRSPPRRRFRRLSRFPLEAHGACLGTATSTVAYPFSNHRRRPRPSLGKAGLIAAPVRGMGRMNSKRVDAFGLRRIKVEPGTTPAQLKRTLFRERVRPF